jgi:hypothetical protein
MPEWRGVPLQELKHMARRPPPLHILHTPRQYMPRLAFKWSMRMGALKLCADNEDPDIEINESDSAFRAAKFLGV